VHYPKDKWILLCSENYLGRKRMQVLCERGVECVSLLKGSLQQKFTANLFRKSDDRLQQAVNGGLFLISLCIIQELRTF
jgi:hypothetical protein